MTQRDTEHSPKTQWRQMALARSKRRGLGLQGQLMLCFTMLLLVALSLTAALVSWQSTTQIRRQMVLSLQETSRSLMRDSAGLMHPEETASLATLAQRELSLHEDLTLIAYYDADGKLLASHGREQSAASANIDINPLQLARSLPVTSGDTAALQTTLPVTNDAMLMGYLRVEQSLEREVAQKWMVTKAIIAVGLLVALASIPAAALVVRGLLRPVNELVDATRRAIAGNLDSFVPVTRQDMIGELAKTFNDLISWVVEHRKELAEANKKLEVANRELASKIEHRTTQLEVANNRLTSEIAEKEDFIRAVSHDLNAPLRNIDGMLTLMLKKQKDKLPSEVVERLERVKANVAVESELINDLLELSRIKSRRGQMTSVDMEKVIWELRGLFDNDLKTREIELVIETSLPRVIGEAARMRQVMQNLIDNAIKYMGEGRTKQIAVGCRLRGGEAEFYVRDTGLGIDPADIDKVFFIFRRGRGEATSKVPGKGVGLASVKTIVESYAGRIWVQSQLGQGTTFYFTINGRFVPTLSGNTPESLNATEQQLAA